MRGDRRRVAAAAAAHAAASRVALAWMSRISRRAAAEQKIVWFNTLRVPFAANRIIRLGFRVLFSGEYGCVFNVLILIRRQIVPWSLCETVL